MNDDREERTRYLQRIRLEDQEKRKNKRRESRIKGAIYILTAIYLAIVVSGAVVFAVFSIGA